jgi:hypothetical protein
MWSAIRWLVLRLVAARWLFKLGGLAFLVPIALLLKTIGLPILGVLGVLAFPILVLLFLFGLPIFLVLLFGSLFIGMLGMVLTLGLAAIKIGLFIVLPAWLVWKLFTKVFRRGGDSHDGTNGGSTKSDTSSDASTNPSSSAAADPIDGIDPA